MNKTRFLTTTVLLLLSSPAMAAPTLSVSCGDEAVSFVMGGLSDGELFTIDVSQNGTSNWISLGGADAVGTSMTIPANVTGSDELDALTDTDTATYRVTTGGQSATANCS